MDISREWIDNNIFLLSSFMLIEPDVFEKNLRSTEQVYEVVKTGQAYSISGIVNAVSKQLDFVPPNIRFDWDGTIDDFDHIKGVMTRGTLVIAFDNLNQYSLAATVLHELMHYFLIHRVQYTLQNNNENEKLTDLAVMVMGFPTIMLNSKIIDEYDLYKKSEDPHWRLGYLNLEETYYAYERILRLRKIPQREFLSKPVTTWIKNNKKAKKIEKQLNSGEHTDNKKRPKGMLSRLIGKR